MTRATYTLRNKAAARASTVFGEGRAAAGDTDAARVLTSAKCLAEEARVGAAPLTDPEGVTHVDYDELDRVIEVRRVVAGQPDDVETYAYNALGALSVHAGEPVDHQRPRIDGLGSASAGIPATHGGQPIALSPVGQVESLLDSAFEYHMRGRLFRVDDAGLQEEYGHDIFMRRIGRLRAGVLENYLYEYHDVDRADGVTEPPANIVAVLDGNDFIQRRFLYEGIDQPLWMFDQRELATIYFELDTIGNVRRLRGGRRLDPAAAPLPSDLGGYRYTAFGRSVLNDVMTPAPAFVSRHTGATAEFEQPIRWQARWFSDMAGGLYDFRARVWSPELGAFLTTDEYGFLGPMTTLWSWPGQNPLRFRDPTGRFVAVGGSAELVGVGAIVGIFAALATYQVTLATVLEDEVEDLSEGVAEVLGIPPLDHIRAIGWRIGGYFMTAWATVGSQLERVAREGTPTPDVGEICRFLRESETDCYYLCPKSGLYIVDRPHSPLIFPPIEPGAPYYVELPANDACPKTVVRR